VLAALVGSNWLIWSAQPDCWTPVVLMFGAVFLAGILNEAGNSSFASALR